MSLKMLSGSLAAAWLACGIGVLAQSGDQKSGTPTISVAGCVEKEAAVLKRPAIAGDIGMGDEFVLTRAKLTPGAKSMDKPETETEPVETVGTSGSLGKFGKVFRVTGQKENELKGYLGQRVEITGAFKHDKDAKAELDAIGNSGRIVTGELTPENTPEITIVSIRALPGSCLIGVPR